MPDELLDVVNARDQVIGQAMRSVVHRDALLHRGVHVFLFTPQRQLIVQQRGGDKVPFPLALDCSVSEHVKAGEDYHAAARRGLLEELGLTGVRLHGLVKFKMFYGPRDHEICTLYEGSAEPARVRFDPLEVEAVACYHLEELEALISGGKVPFCGWFVQLIHWYLGMPADMQLLKVYPQGRPLDHSDR